MRMKGFWLIFKAICNGVVFIHIILQILGINADHTDAAVLILAFLGTMESIMQFLNEKT